MVCLALRRPGQGLSGRPASLRSMRARASSAPSPPPSLPKNFDPITSEERLYNWWEGAGHFMPSPGPGSSSSSSSNPPFTISMPPPNVTGKLHMGHAMFVTLQDIMTRYQRMRGRSTFWVPGTDHAGIATQMVVERMLKEQGVTKDDLGRDAFEEKVWEWKEQYGGYITQQLRRLGASCDWSKERFTLDEGLCDAVVEAFVQLHEKGLVYKGAYLVNWDSKLQTAVSDLEVEYSEEQGTLYYFKYPIEGDASAEHLEIATTRPETILGDTALAVHPEDARFKHLVGKRAVVPMSGGRTIPIIADTYVDMEFGTGALKITPGHDVNDYELGRRHDLETINIMNNDGTLNGNAGAYEGMDRFVARKALWKDLMEAGLGVREEAHVQRVPRSQRGGEIVEPLVREQWFVKMEGLAKPALAAVERGETKIIPERFEKIYRNWLVDIKDWCVSRQLWWGHRIPVWYVFADEASADAAGGVGSVYVVARNEAEAAERAREEHGEGVVLRQEVGVLDTWFSSSLWPFSTLGWPNVEAEDLLKFYPTSVMETGHDILFFWVARMMMMGIEFTGKAPFETIYLHGLVRDEKGRKMSKSLGNVVDPVETIEKYGADALRFSLATGTSPGQDLNLSLDKVNGARNFTNKVWNVAKFVLFSLEQAGIGPGTAAWDELAGVSLSSEASIAGMDLPERWIISRMHETVNQSIRAHERYDFSEAGRLMYDFIWSDFADWYVETAKSRLYGDDAKAAETTRAVLVYVLQNILKLAHPYMPFITEELWQAIPTAAGEPALISASWPVENGVVDAEALDAFESFQSTVRSIRNARAEYEVEPGKKIEATVVTSSPSLCTYFNQERQSLALLAKLDGEKLSITEGVVKKESGADSKQIELVVREGLEVVLPLAGLFDASKEIERLQKQGEKISKELEGLENRLSNKSFVDKAPENVVAEVKANAKELSDQLAVIEGKIAGFSTTVS